MAKQAVTYLCLWTLLWMTSTTQAAPRTQRSSQLSPIIIVPGKAGNQMEAKVDKDWSFYNHCPLKRGWHRVWVDAWVLFTASRTECWSENMQLYLDPDTQRRRTAPGVEFRIPGWGTTEGVEYLDPYFWSRWMFAPWITYMAPFVKELEKMGYTSGVDVRSAPYDFRFAPAFQTEYMSRLKTLVEETYSDNGQRQVILVGHSLGGLMIKYFLNMQTAEWRQTYVKSFISVNAPWGGSVKIAHLLVSGDDFGMSFIRRTMLRDQQRSFETSYFLLPRGDAWGGEDTVVYTATKNYTTQDYHELFEDMGYAEGSTIYDYSTEGVEDVMASHPGVPTFCFHGSNISTAGALKYDRYHFPHGRPKAVYTDGDGTVTVRSLRYAERWQQDEIYGNNTHLVAVPGYDHDAVFQAPSFLQWLEQHVFGVEATLP